MDGRAGRLEGTERRPRIVTVVGARPQFIKAAPLSRALRRHADEVLVHTGQHYDPEMSDRFFAELGLPPPDHRLGVEARTHGEMTGTMLARIERVLVESPPDLVVVFGDTNSTLAGALAAVKLGIPVAHVEAGLRSFDRRMPEEVNRRLTDHMSDLLFCPTPVAVENLRREGIAEGVVRVGDVMLDAVRSHAALARQRGVESFGVDPGRYLVATIHRQENTDDPSRLAEILEALDAAPLPVVLPLHPRTRKRMEACGLVLRGSVRTVGPVGYLEMLALVDSARALLTDSGGLQKEAFILRTPCITLRDTTEWVETIEARANVLVGADSELIAKELRGLDKRKPDWRAARVYGDGKASERIVRAILALLASSRRPSTRPSSPGPRSGVRVSRAPRNSAHRSRGRQTRR